MARLRDIIEGRELYFVGEDSTVLEAARRMAYFGVGAILVLESGSLRGLFSERDLLTRVVAGGLSPDETPMTDVMSTELAVIDESSSVDEALEMMQRNNCRHLPVMRQGAVRGMISMRDLMNFELERRSGGFHIVNLADGART